MFSGPGSPIARSQNPSSAGIDVRSSQASCGVKKPSSLAPHPFGVGRETLVQPGLVPGVDREEIAEPLVGELVDDDEVVGPPAEEERRVDRSRLVLEGEPDGPVLDDAARRARTDTAPNRSGLPGDDLGLSVERQSADPRAGPGTAGTKPDGVQVFGFGWFAVRRRGSIGPAVERVAVGLESGRALRRSRRRPRRGSRPGPGPRSRWRRLIDSSTCSSVRRRRRPAGRSRSPSRRPCR